MQINFVPSAPYGTVLVRFGGAVLNKCQDEGIPKRVNGPVEAGALAPKEGEPPHRTVVSPPVTAYGRLSRRAEDSGRVSRVPSPRSSKATTTPVTSARVTQ